MTSNKKSLSRCLSPAFALALVLALSVGCSPRRLCNVSSSPDQRVMACTNAIAIEAGIEARTDDRSALAIAFNNRGLAYRNNGDFDRAIADYDAAILLDPESAPIFDNRGVVKFVLGRFAESASDFARVLELEPADTSAALGWYLSRSKAGQADTEKFVRITATLDLDRWPGPIVRLYLGQTSPDEVRSQASMGADGDTQQARVCEAAFYIAEYHLMRGDTNAARPLLQEASTTCPHVSLFAVAELNRLP